MRLGPSGEGPVSLPVEDLQDRCGPLPPNPGLTDLGGGTVGAGEGETHGKGRGAWSSRLGLS